MTGQRVSPSQLRDTFAVRYLQAGGEQEALRDILGLRGKEALKRYEQLSTWKIENDPQKEVIFSNNQERAGLLVLGEEAGPGAEVDP
jgi:hypothetical protein